MNSLKSTLSKALLILFQDTEESSPCFGFPSFQVSERSLTVVERADVFLSTNLVKRHIQAGGALDVTGSVWNSLVIQMVRRTNRELITNMDIKHTVNTDRLSALWGRMLVTKDMKTVKDKSTVMAKDNFSPDSTGMRNTATLSRYSSAMGRIIVITIR